MGDLVCKSLILLVFPPISRPRRGALTPWPDFTEIIRPETKMANVPRETVLETHPLSLENQTPKKFLQKLF